MCFYNLLFKLWSCEVGGISVSVMYKTFSFAIKLLFLKAAFIKVIMEIICSLLISEKI